jgi:hypothetical protein
MREVLRNLRTKAARRAKDALFAALHLDPKKAAALSEEERVLHFDDANVDMHELAMHAFEIKNTVDVSAEALAFTEMTVSCILVNPRFY